MNKYQRTIKGQAVDVYDVLVAWDVACPATAHAIKKLLMPGQRGSKGAVQDLNEARESISRAIELAEQEEALDLDSDQEKTPSFVKPKPTTLVAKGTIWEAEDGTSLEFMADVKDAHARIRYIARVNGEFLSEGDEFPYSKFFAKMPIGKGPYVLLLSVKVRLPHGTA